MDKLFLKAKTRKILGNRVQTLRRKNLIPAVVYGHGLKTNPLVIEYKPFEKIYLTAGESSLIDLGIDEKDSVKVLIQDVQTDPISGSYLHVDFHQVKMTEKITTEVILDFVGESRAVKELGGILVRNLDQVRIECLPKDLIHSIKVDISTLDTFEKIIRVADLKLPAGIEVKDKQEEVITLVQPPRTEEELKELEEKPEEAKVEEVEKVEKKEEAEEKPEEQAKVEGETVKEEQPKK